MRSHLALLGLASLIAIANSIDAAAQNSATSGHALCKQIDATGLASAPCAVSAWNSSVTATIDMNSDEARKLCAQISGLMRQSGTRFDPGWTLQIRSPYSGENSIAYCAL
jgi:hypothetical protein